MNNSTGVEDLNMTENFTLHENATEMSDVKSLAMNLRAYKIGDGINKSYFPILVPVGVLGNILSFLVMIQKHNRHISISLYISVLAITDTIVLLLGFVTYLSMEHDVSMPPDPTSYCVILNTSFFAATMCSTLFILSMTFDRFYSIIRPHKAASVNTVKRAKITIACIIIFSVLFNIPHIFITGNEGGQCVPYGKAMKYVYGQFYYWFSFAINFVLPFVLLLIMNGFIIQTIRNRFKDNNNMATDQGPSQGRGQGKGQGQTVMGKTTTKQVYIILLLVTFSFLILTTPGYIILLYIMKVDYEKSPEAFAEFFLLDNIGQKTYYTNCGINFFLYVLSGRKFRTDVVKLFTCKKGMFANENSNSDSVDTNTRVSSI